MSDEFNLGPRSFRPLHTDWAPREVDGISLDNPNATLEDYVARSMAVADALRALPGTSPVGIAGSQWSTSIWDRVDSRRERFIFTNGWPTCFRVRDAFLEAGFSGNRQGVVWAEGGLPLSGLNYALHQRGLSLPTFGTNNGQTTAGIISTGAHGSGYDFGAIHEAVRGIHLKFGPSDAHDVYIEGDRPTVQESFVRERLRVGRVIRDRKLFNAVVVGLGCFGVIRGVVLETEQLFDFERFNIWYAWNGTFKNALSKLDFNGLRVPRALERIDQYVGPRKSASNVKELIAGRDLHHIEVFFNPNGPDDKNVQLNLMVKDLDRETNRELRRPLRSYFNYGSGFVEIMTRLMASGVLPSAISASLLSSEVDARYKEGWYRGTIRALFQGEVHNGAVVSSGISMGADRAVEALELVSGYYRREYLAKDRALPIVMAQRFVKCGDAYLAYARKRSQPGSNHPFPETTCILEIDGAGTPGVERFLEECLCLLDSRGIDFTLHWGKTLGYYTLSDRDYRERCQASVGRAVRRKTLAQRYGRDLTRWRAEREKLLTSKAQKLFAPRYLKKIGVLP